MCDSNNDEEPIPETIRSNRGSEIITLNIQIEVENPRQMTCDEKWEMYMRHHKQAQEKPVCVYENVVLSEDYPSPQIPIDW